MRNSTRNIAPWLCIAALLAAAPACSSEPTDENDAGGGGADTGGGESDVVEEDASETDAGITEDATVEDTAEADAGPVDAGPEDAGTEDAGPQDTGTVDAGPEDAGSVDEDTGGEADTGPEDTGPPPQLNLPECIQKGGDQAFQPTSCEQCELCESGGIWQICVSGKNFDNECQAVCEFQVFKPDTLQDIDPNATPGECPPVAACAACQGVDFDKPDGPFCATLDSGAQQEVDFSCLKDCLPLKDSTQSSFFKGNCKAACTKPVAQGGAGCSLKKYQPVCAQDDGQTYASECAMQACDQQGCYAVGFTQQTGGCSAGNMVKECDGECFDAQAYPGCTGDCAPVCADLGGLMMTFRSKCVALADGAKVSDCSYAGAQSEKCSAQLYEEMNKACCKDVDYLLDNPVCAADGSGPDANWVTFRSKGEYDCFNEAEPGKWLFQYSNPCVCKCNNVAKPVCGVDKITYVNACSAECYNSDNPQFTYTNGACDPNNP